MGLDTYMVIGALIGCYCGVVLTHIGQTKGKLLMLCGFVTALVFLWPLLVLYLLYAGFKNIFRG